MSPPLPTELGFCKVVEDFLSPAECQALIRRAETAGFRAAVDDYPPSYRDNDRLVVDDPALARQLFARLTPHAPASLVVDDAAGAREPWSLTQLNERLRFCRYRAGQQFQLHQDGVFHLDEQQQSRLTFMVYLTDGSAFSGGDTLFYARGPSAAGAPPVVARVRPRAGMLILFDHGLWHAGEPVTRGLKHILRSDLIYRRARRDAPAPFVGHQGYVWTLARLARGIASGGRDRAIRLWSDDGVGNGVLSGHTQSVLGLVACGPQHLASVSRDRTLKLWDLSTQRCLHSVVAHRAAALCVAAVPGGALATGGADHEINLWLEDARRDGTLRGHTGWVWALAVLAARAASAPERDQHPTSLLASASEDGTVRLWNLAQRTCCAVLPGHVPLRTITVAPDQTCLASGDNRGRVQLWTDLSTRPRLCGSFAAHDAAVRRLVFLDAHTLASAGEDGLVRTWRRSDLTLRSEARHGNFATDVLAVGEDRFVSCAYDGKLMVHHRRAA